MASTDSITTLAGFTVLPLAYSSSSVHYLYIRAHVGSSKKGKSVDLPHGRTLFVANVPPDATERALIILFKHCGVVEKVIFDLDAREPKHEDDSDEEGADEDDAGEGAVGGEEKPRKRRKVEKGGKPQAPAVIPLPSEPVRTLRKTGHFAYIIFLDSNSLNRAVTKPQRYRPLALGLDVPAGLARYTSLYDSLRPPLDSVRQHADSAIQLYEYELAKNKQKTKYRKGEAIVDEDGFTLVTRGGAYGQTLGGGVGVASKKFQETGQSTRNRSQKKQEKEKEGFYAFQKAEKQRNREF